MSEATNNAPSVEQLATARTAHWHQNAEPLLTIESLRNWLTTSGLVLYTPRASQIPSPAPSFVEATLGTANAAPSIAETDAARSLLARLIAEGVAVPLNLLGVTGGLGSDVPDFICSAAVFSYIFTLRGNKAWKLAPVTSGPVKVSPLALATYEILAAKVTLSAYDLATQLGKEVTEAAVLRALTELWSQLRVIPIPQLDGSATLWELSSTRFTKQIKAGANAGQPTALSALISLYLGQSLLATEDEIETFLSPLAPRSRLRDVVHALLSARQLETLVIDGKTLLHVAGDAPAFLAAAKPEAAEGETIAASTDESEDADAPRISKFTPKPGSKIGTGLRTRPAFGTKPAYGSKPAFGADRDRRPFKRDGEGAGRPSYNKPSFSKPWDEDKAARPAASSEGGERPAFRPRTDRPAFGSRPSFGGSRPAFGSRPSAGGSRPSFGDSRPPRRDFGSSEGRPPRREFGSGDSRPPRRDFGSDARPPRREFTPGEGRPPRREFTPRPEGGDFAPRKTFSKPGTFGRKREGGFSPKPSFGGDSRPPRREFGSDSRPPRRDFGGSSEGRPSRPFNSDRGERKPFAGRSDRPAGGDRPSFGGDRPSFGGSPARKSFTPRPGGDRPSFGGKPSFGSKPSFNRDRGGEAGGAGTDAPRKVFRKFDAPRSPKPFGDRPARPFNSDRPARPFNPDAPRGEGRPSFGSKPSFGGGKPSFGAKKPFSKPGGGFAKSGSTFAKFADGAKPFRKPGPGKPSSGGGRPPMRERKPGSGGGYKGGR